MSTSMSSFMTSPFKMEIMLHQANRVLDRAAKADQDGILKSLCQRAKGVILISVFESGVLVSGAAGIGVMIIKDSVTNSWSPPCACGMASTSWGFSVGAVIKDVIIFALDDKSVKAFTSKVGLQLGLDANVTLGTLDYSAAANVNVSGSGTQGNANVQNLAIGGTISVAFSQGAYANASVGGGVVGPRDMVNRLFYNDHSITAHDILYGDVEVPPNKVTNVINEVYEKLESLQSGETLNQDKGSLFFRASSYLASSVFSVLQRISEAVDYDSHNETTNSCEVEGAQQQISSEDSISSNYSLGESDDNSHCSSAESMTTRCSSVNSTTTLCSSDDNSQDADAAQTTPATILAVPTYA